jgi:hypothetical protein
MQTPFAERITENSWTGVDSSGPVATLTESHQGPKRVDLGLKFSSNSPP